MPSGRSGARRSTCSATAARPWVGTTVLESDVTDALEAAPELVAAGMDLLRVEIPIGRELAARLTDAGIEVPEWRPSQRGRRGRPRSGRSEPVEPAPDRQPARPDRTAPRAGPGRRRATRVRPAGDRGTGAVGAGERRRRGLRADRPRRIGPDERDRRGRRGPGPGARGPRLRPSAARTLRDAGRDRAGTAGRRTGPARGRAVGCRHAIRSRPRAPAHLRRAGPGRRRAGRADRGRRPAGLARRRAVPGRPRDRRGRRATGVVPGPGASASPSRPVPMPRTLRPIARWPHILGAALVHAGDVAVVLRNGSAIRWALARGHARHDRRGSASVAARDGRGAAGRHRPAARRRDAGAPRRRRWSDWRNGAGPRSATTRAGTWLAAAARGRTRSRSGRKPFDPFARAGHRARWATPAA